jgi:hypothetical protein
VYASDALVVDACRFAMREANTQVSLTTRPVLFALTRAHLARAGRMMSRGTNSSPVHFAARKPMNRIGPGCVSKSGDFARSFARLAEVKATKLASCSRLRRASDGRGVGAPVEEPHAAVLALLADGEAWSSSALAIALGAGPRTVQRALDLACKRRQGTVTLAAGRARRWTTPSMPDFPTTLLLPGPLPGD